MAASLAARSNAPAVGPGVCEVPAHIISHWYLAANIKSGNITIIEKIKAPVVIEEAA
jgi:hypothetical protein